MEQFSLIPQPQEPGHCGPTSLSSCLAVLGFNVDQRQIAKAINKPFKTYAEGVDEFEIRKAATKYGVRTKYWAQFEKEKGPTFAHHLCLHLNRGLPAILLVQNFSHWVALLGFIEEKKQYIVMDPDDRSHAFNRWSEHTLLREGWNSCLETGQPDQYFSILTRRKDGRPARWRITDAFLRLVNMGSEQTADEMLNDLIEMARRARCEPKGNGKIAGPFLNQILVKHEKVVLSSVEHWAAYNRRTVKPRALRSLYHNYTVVAASAGLRLAKGSDPSAIVAQMTSVLTTYAWFGKL